MNVEETRHPDWIPVEPGAGAIREGDRYRVEYTNGFAGEYARATRDYTRHDFDDGNAYYIWPRPEPKPYEAIPRGRENAAVMAVSVHGRPPVVGTYYRESKTLCTRDPDSSRSLCFLSGVTSAVPVTAVPDEALEALLGAFARWEDGDVGMDTIEWGKVVSNFLAAIDEADQ